MSVRNLAAVAGMLALAAWTGLCTARAAEPGSAVTVIATITAQPGKAAELEKLLRADYPASLKDPGMLRYELNRSASDPNTFLFVERWESPDALKAHLGAPHVVALLKALYPNGMTAGSEIVAGQPSVQMYQQLH